MDFAIIFVALITFNIYNNVYSMECYTCAGAVKILTIGQNITRIPPCTHFDGSSAYVVDCPFSTMCSRIISTIYLQNEKEHRTLTLGCAQQKSSRHVLHNNRWKEEYSLKEYTEECKTINDNNLVGATITYCYCRGRLCNSGNRYNFSLASVTFIIVLTTLNTIA